MLCTRSIVHALALAAPLAIGAIAVAQSKPFADDPALSGLPERWGELTDLLDVPGASVTVVKDGQVFVETLGVRDPATGEPVTPDTMFYIASITKTHVATAICALAAEGRLSLDDPVKQHLPRFALPDADLTETITIRDLLCHRYGVNSGEIVLLDAYTGEITEDRYWHWLSRGQAAGELAYTNVHFTLLGKVIERITGKDWRDYLDEAVFQPAGMTRTTGYASRMYDDADAAIPSERVDGAFRATEQRKTDRTMHAAGGLGTTAMDSARYIMLHLNGGEIDGARVLPASLTDEMQTLHAAYDEHQGSIRIEKGRGLGWTVGDYANEAPIRFHGGGYVGTRAWLCILPEQDAGLMIMVNGGGYARAWADIVAIDLLERLTNIAPPWSPYEEWPAQIRERKANEAEEAAGAPADAGVRMTKLTRPLGLYTGYFHNEHFGTLRIERDGDAFHCFLGDRRLPLLASGSPDEMLVESFEPPGRLRFVVSPGGEVDTVRFIEADLGEFEFVR